MAAKDTLEPCRPWPCRWFLSVLALAVVVRGGTLVWFHPNLDQDPDAYRRLAANILATGTYGLHASCAGVVQPTAYRPPLYPLLLAACMKAPGDPRWSIAGAHLALGLATVAGVVALGQRLGLRRMSLLAGLLVACDPILLYQSTLPMTETLATLLATVALFSLVQAGAHATAGAAALAGGSLALATLCRPAFLVPLVAAGPTLVCVAPTWRRRLSVGAALSCTAAIVLMPWIVRNAIQMQQPIVTTTHGGYTLRLGNNPSFYAFLARGAWGEVWRGQQSITPPGPMPGPSALDNGSVAGREWTTDRWYYAEALKTIRSHPGMFVRACLARLACFWQLVPHQVDPRETTWHRCARFAVGGWYLVEFALAAAGLWSLGRALSRDPWLWTALLCGSFTLVHVGYWSDMRMRAPIMPAVALLAAAGARTGRERRPAAEDPRPGGDHIPDKAADRCRAGGPEFRGRRLDDGPTKSIDRARRPWVDDVLI